ncbi:MAG: hypothetical protein HYZ00_07895, partial [Candidatus Hydrogenedentes bacterium]|nr:hypothetical protein [Candidatus Hydrogenedentota bacterium]
MSRMLTFLCLSCLIALGAAAQSIHTKAEVFQHDMEQRFLLEGQALCKLMLPTGDRTFVAYNMPDNAYMTGIYLGTLAKKYAVTKADADLEKARETLRALHKLCAVSGREGLLARAFWPKDRPLADDGGWRETADKQYLWRGDVSSDQMDGTVYGFAFAYDLFANVEEKKLIGETVAALVDYV